MGASPPRLSRQKCSDEAPEDPGCTVVVAPILVEEGLDGVGLICLGCNQIASGFWGELGLGSLTWRAY